MNLAEKIKTARVAKGLTQQELAVLCEVAISTISRIEVGTTKKIPKLLKRELTKILGVDL